MRSCSLGDVLKLSNLRGELNRVNICCKHVNSYERSKVQPHDYFEGICLLILHPELSNLLSLPFLIHSSIFKSIFSEKRAPLFLAPNFTLKLFKFLWIFY